MNKEEAETLIYSLLGANTLWCKARYPSEMHEQEKKMTRFRALLISAIVDKSNIDGEPAGEKSLSEKTCAHPNEHLRITYYEPSDVKCIVDTHKKMKIVEITECSALVSVCCVSCEWRTEKQPAMEFLQSRGIDHVRVRITS